MRIADRTSAARVQFRAFDRYASAWPWLKTFPGCRAANGSLLGRHGSSQGAGVPQTDVDPSNPEVVTGEGFEIGREE